MTSPVWVNAISAMSANLIGQLAKVYAGKPVDGSDYGIHCAARKNRADVVQVLLPYEGGYQQSQEHTALMIAAQLGFLDVILVTLEREKDIYTSTGVDALMLASSAGQLEACKLLLPAIGARDDYMMFTALHYAAASGFKDVCEYLLNESVYELSVIQAAADIADRNGHEEITEYLQVVANAAIAREEEEGGEVREPNMMVEAPLEQEPVPDSVVYTEMHRGLNRRFKNKSLLISIPETPKGRIRYPTPKAEPLPNKQSQRAGEGRSRIATAAQSMLSSSMDCHDSPEVTELQEYVSVLENENKTLRENLANSARASAAPAQPSSDPQLALSIEMEKTRLLSQDLLRMYHENAVLRVKLAKLGERT